MKGIKERRERKSMENEERAGEGRERNAKVANGEKAREEKVKGG